MANSTQVVRIETRDRLADAKYRHYVGLIRPATRRDVEPAVHVFADDMASAREALALEAFRRRRGRHGKPAKECVDFVFAGPPQYGTPEEWSPEKELQWATDTVEWARDVLGPESVIAVAALHRDETSPHVHLLAIPVADGKLGWCRVRDQAMSRIAPKRGKKYSRIQDDFQLRVAARYGLARGTVGSKATHQAIDRQRAAEHAARIAAADAERTRAQAEQAAQDVIDAGQLQADTIHERALFDAAQDRERRAREDEQRAQEEERLAAVHAQERERVRTAHRHANKVIEGTRSSARRAVLASDGRVREAEEKVDRLTAEKGTLERRLAQVTQGREAHVRRALESTVEKVVAATEEAQARREERDLAQARLEVAEQRIAEQRAEHAAQLQAVDQRWSRATAALQKGHRELTAENEALRRQLAQRQRPGRRGSDVSD